MKRPSLAGSQAPNDNLKSWMDVGWYLGSYADHYEEPDVHHDHEDDVAADRDESLVDNELETSLKAPNLSPRRRSKQLNDVMRAMIRAMVEVRNGESIAYAMDKTNRHFTEHQLEKNESKEAKEWRAAQQEYLEMGWYAQSKWRDRIMQRHAKLEKLARL